MNPNERDRLLDRYLHGSLAVDEERLVHKLLLDDPSAARRLAELSLIDCMLVTLSEQEQALEEDGVTSVLGEVIEQDEQMRAWEGAHLAQMHREEVRVVAANAFERFKAQERRRQEELARRRYLARRRQLAIGAFATMALFLVSISVWLANRPSRPDSPSVSQPVSPKEAVPLPTIARISRASGAHWRRRDVAPVLGSGLTAGSFFLDKGFVEITFDSEARLIVEAPSRIELVDGRRVKLGRGILTAHVPEQARGFEVETPSARVTDLGTEFALAVDRKGAADVHVLDGWVATSFIAPGQNQQQQVKALHQDSAMRFDARAGTMRTIDIDGERFARSWDDVLYKPSIDGSIRFEKVIPPSLYGDIVEDRDSIRLFLEATDVVLEEDTRIDVMDPGVYDSFDNLSGVIPAGTVVDSYLLHWDPANTASSLRMAAGRVKFRRPILGVICALDELLASERLFGFSDQTYQIKGVGRHLESYREPETADRVVLSQDRLALDVVFQAQKVKGLDQVRILVAAPGGEEK